MKNQKGVVILNVAICLIVFCLFTAFTLDVGLAIYNKRKMQIGADAASFAGAGKLLETTDTTQVYSLTKTVGTLNTLTSNEVNTVGAVEVGKWDASKKLFYAYTSPYNAVRVFAEREVPAYFAGIINVHAMHVKVESISLIDSPSSASCLVPFGVTQAFMNSASYNTTQIIGTDNQGNWGKVQIGDVNLNSKPGFIDAIANDVCYPDVHINDSLPTATGFAGVTEGFKQRIDSNPFVVMPIVSDFGSGGSDPVIIKGFLYAELISIQSKGNEWTLTFRPVKGLVTGQGAGPVSFASVRILVK